MQSRPCKRVLHVSSSCTSSLLLDKPSSMDARPTLPATSFTLILNVDLPTDSTPTNVHDDPQTSLKTLLDECFQEEAHPPSKLSPSPSQKSEEQWHQASSSWRHRWRSPMGRPMFLKAMGRHKVNYWLSNYTLLRDSMHYLAHVLLGIPTEATIDNYPRNPGAYLDARYTSMMSFSTN